ncbi:MAG: MerR family transcriptional regulator [Sandaracinus sp.]
MDDGGRKLEEVAKAAGVSPRTVRYYIQRGLLPPPRFRGPDTAYGDEHVVRLRAIRRLQEAYWPLDAIGGLFASKTEREIEAIADGSHVPAPSTSVASPAPAPTPTPSSARSGRLPRATAEPPRVVQRITLAEDLVVEVPLHPSDDTAALLEAIRTLVAKRR